MRVAQNVNQKTGCIFSGKKGTPEPSADLENSEKLDRSRQATLSKQTADKPQKSTVLKQTLHRSSASGAFFWCFFERLTSGTWLFCGYDLDPVKLSGRKSSSGILAVWKAM